MKKIIILLLVVLIVGVLAFFYFSQEEEVESDIPEEKGELSILELILADEAREEINLIAVDNSNSSGKAYRLFKDGVFYHAVVANMPDPGESRYEGWLVVPSPLKFFSTGVMKKQEDQWILEFKSQQPLPEYYRVAITLEATVDPNPEGHVLEGDFSEEADFGQELEAKEETVEIEEFSFRPSKIIVKKGTTVTWINRDRAVHTATSNDGVFDSGNLSRGESFSYTFDEEGVFGYFCRPHPFMLGEIVVE